ncbi:hypothetical protein [Catenulispora subtropica]|uniref:Uncharacterized protein n=1 Tax=Catenulispora subtropica TaxID=450798 RepID=A0ABP5ENM9_9ACTN
MNAISRRTTGRRGMGFAAVLAVVALGTSGPVQQALTSGAHGTATVRADGFGWQGSATGSADGDGFGWE